MKARRIVNLLFLVAVATSVALAGEDKKLTVRQATAELRRIVENVFRLEVSGGIPADNLRAPMALRFPKGYPRRTLAVDLSALRGLKVDGLVVDISEREENVFVEFIYRYERKDGDTGMVGAYVSFVFERQVTVRPASYAEYAVAGPLK